jgi:hypothetical protein
MLYAVAILKNNHKLNNHKQKLQIKKLKEDYHKTQMPKA